MAERERRYVLLEVVPEEESESFQDDSYEDALTEQGMMEMLAKKLGYVLIKAR
jgi:hypothetical protein